MENCAEGSTVDTFSAFETEFWSPKPELLLEGLLRSWASKNMGTESRNGHGTGALVL